MLTLGIWAFGRDSSAVLVDDTSIVAAIEEEKLSRSTGMGLKIMNYRASIIGASLEIKGTGSSGTLVTCSLPVEAKK